MQQERLFRGDFPFKQKSQEILKRKEPWALGEHPISSPLKGSLGFLLGGTSRHLEAAPTSSSSPPGNPAQVPGSRSRVSLVALIRWVMEGGGASTDQSPAPSVPQGKGVIFTQVLRNPIAQPASRTVGWRHSEHLLWELRP